MRQPKTSDCTLTTRDNRNLVSGSDEVIGHPGHDGWIWTGLTLFSKEWCGKSKFPVSRVSCVLNAVKNRPIVNELTPKISHENTKPDWPDPKISIADLIPSLRLIPTQLHAIDAVRRKCIGASAETSDSRGVGVQPAVDGHCLAVAGDNLESYE